MAYGQLNIDKTVTSWGDTTGGLYGFKNRIINGAMGIWQRGTSGFTTNLNYAADRWLIGTATSLSAVAQSSDVPSGFKYSLSINGTNYPSANQRIESVNCTDLVGQSVTISFWAKQTSGAGSNSIYLQLFYANSADTFSGLTQIGSNALFTGTSGWVQYTTTFTNLPAGAANGIAVAIGFNGGGSATTLLTGVQLEKGTTATSFDYRPYGTELALCQRYYWKCTASLGSSFSTSGTAGGGVRMPVTMRTTPTLEAGGTFAVSSGSAGAPTAYTSTGGGTGGDAVNVYNSSNNWTLGQAVSLTAGFTAEL